MNLYLLLALPFAATIRDLGADSFPTRHAAEQRLRSAGVLAAPALLLARPDSPEADRRVGELLDRLTPPPHLLWAVWADRWTDKYILERKAELSGIAEWAAKEYTLGQSRVPPERIRDYMSRPYWHSGTEAGDWRLVMKQWVTRKEETK